MAGPGSVPVSGFFSSTTREVTILVMLAIGTDACEPAEPSTPGNPTAPMALCPEPGQAGRAAGCVSAAGAASSAAVAGTGAKPVPARYTTAARTTAREPKKATRRRRKIWRLVSGIRQFYRSRTRLHAQGVQGDRAGRGHVERIDTVEHGDRDDRVGGGQRLAAEPVADTVVTIPMLHGVDSLN